MMIKTQLMDARCLRKISKALIFLTPFIVFSALVLPLCFQNNDYLALTSSQFVDSGSILSSIFQLMENASFYNQNILYHTAYGYPFNSILFWLFMVLKHLVKLSTTTDFYAFATAARLVNYAIAILVLCVSFLIAQRVFLKNSTVFLFMFVLSFFPPFLLYTVQIKPDLLGVLFLSCSMWFLQNFLENEREQSIVMAFFFAALAVITKQPFIFWLIPLILVTFMVNKESLSRQALLVRFLRTAIKSIFLFVPIFFIFHPFAFLDPAGLVNKQLFLLNENASADAFSNIRAWAMVIHDNLYLLPLIIIPFISVLIPHKTETDKRRVILIAIYVLVYIIWLIIKVGPMRFPAYFLMIIVPGSLLSVYICERIFLRISNKVAFLRIITFLMPLSLVFYLYYPHALQNINDIYDYKKSAQYMSIERIAQNKTLYYELLNSRILYSVSIPLPTDIMPYAVNTWQFGKGEEMEKNLIAYRPDYVIVDSFQWWEEPLEYWRTIAESSGLKYVQTIISDPNEPDKQIVIFMKKIM